MTQTNQNPKNNLNDIFFQQKTTGVDYNELLEEVQIAKEEMRKHF